MFYFALASCQQQVPTAIKNNLPEGTTISKDMLRADFECNTCKEIEQKIRSRLTSENSIELHSESYVSWEACLKNNKNVSVFLLTPGDYRKWGTLKLQGKFDLVFTHKNHLKILAKQNPQHPVNMLPQDQVILGNFIFLNCRNITLNGLSFEGNDYHPKVEKYGGLAKQNCQWK